MNIAVITKTRERIDLKLYDENLKNLTDEIFEDIYTLNFFLQTIPKTFGQDKTLLIFNDMERKYSTLDFPKKDADLEDYYHHNIKLLLAKDENSYFIQE